MNARLLLVALAVILTACDSSDAPATPSATVDPAVTATPSYESAYVYDVDTFERVNNVAGSGRVPLGLINTVAISFADARFEGFYVTEDLPSAVHLTLTMVNAAAKGKDVASNDRTHQSSYEWWFRTVTDVNATAVPAEGGPTLRITMRETGPGVWSLFADTGSGWTALTDATYQIGVFEVSAEVPLDKAWGMNRNTTKTFYRAVVRYDPFVIGDDRKFGWVYPEDLSWREVFPY